MTYEQIGLGIAAAAVAVWPQIQKAGTAVLKAVRPVAAPGGPVASVSYEVAIHDLAVVRARLAATGMLSDDVRKAEILKAIDTLTLALVAGSDK